MQCSVLQCIDIELLEREFISSNDAEARLTEEIDSRYPFEKKTLFDSLLANFILFHPEHTQIVSTQECICDRPLFDQDYVLVPLIKKIAAKQLVYSKKNPPFYAFLSLFTPSQTATSKLGHFPCQQILGCLTTHNFSYDSFPLSSWITDLIIEASATLRDAYLTGLVDKHQKQQAQDRTGSNFVKQLVSLVDEERVRYKNFVICNSVVPIVVKGMPKQLHLFSDIQKRRREKIEEN